MDITIRATLGSSTQLLLFSLSILTILGWTIRRKFEPGAQTIEIYLLFLGVLVTNCFILQGSRSNYLTGALCIGLYVLQLPPVTMLMLN